MKAKMDEIDEIWAIYRRNLDQNSRQNINLPLKINFGHWIKNWEQSGRWIVILPLESHLGRRINTGVIQAIRSCCMKEGKYRQKISDLSLIYLQYIADILAIFAEISPLRFFSTKYRVDPFRYTTYRQYITDISQHFPPCL